MICDLSSPAGSSVNDGIPSNLCSLHCATVNDAVRLIQQLGRGSQLVKLDIKDAYRIVPVHSDDYYLLGTRSGRVAHTLTELYPLVTSQPQRYSMRLLTRSRGYSAAKGYIISFTT